MDDDIRGPAQGQGDGASQMLGAEPKHRFQDGLEVQRSSQRLRSGGYRVEPGDRPFRAIASSCPVDGLGALLSDRTEQREFVVAERRSRRVGGGEGSDRLAPQEHRDADEGVVGLLSPADQRRIASVAFFGRGEHNGTGVTDRVRHRQALLQPEATPVAVIALFVSRYPDQRDVVTFDDADGPGAGAGRADPPVQHDAHHVIHR